MKLRYMVLISLLVGVTLSVATFAAQTPMQEGLTTAASTGLLLPANSDKSATELTAAKIGDIIKGVLQMIGVVFMLLTLYGGFVYMTAGGNHDRVKSGRAYLVNATIGLAIIAASYAATSYIMSVLLTK